MKPGEDCNSYICLLVAAAALAKPKSELPSYGPRKRAGLPSGWLGPSLPGTAWLGQLSMRQGTRKGGAGLLNGSGSPGRLGSFLLFLMGVRAVLRVPVR